MLEFYDFFIYTQAAALVFPSVFFPSDDPSLAIIASLGTFGVGYLARPVGAFTLEAMGDRVGRRRTLILTMALMGALSFAYLWAITHGRLWLTLVIGLAMWGVLYQGYNAVFPSFFPELFPTATRVTGMAIGQNIGTAASSLMAMVFAGLCPPGSGAGSIVLIVGGLTLLLTLLVALAAWASPETHLSRAEDLDAAHSRASARPGRAIAPAHPITEKGQQP